MSDSILMSTKYEVQFRDGQGAWRRWSLKSTREQAEESYRKLLEHFGRIPAAESFCRIVEVRR